MVKSVERMSVWFVVGLALAQGVVVTGCRRSPAQAQARFLERGKAHLTAKDNARAAIEFRNAVAAIPTAAEPHYQLGLAYLASGQVSDAADQFRRTIQLQPTHVDAQVRLAELMLRGADPVSLTEAEKYARDALRIAPDNVDAMNAVALAEIKLGDSDDAEQQLRTTLQRFPQNLNASVVLATVKLQQRDFPGAEAVLKSAASKAPQSANAALALGQLYTIAGRWRDAEAQFRNAIQLDGQNGVAFSGLATAQLMQGHKDDAERSYRLLSQLPDKRYRHRHAAYLLEQGNSAAALKELEAIAAEDPKDTVARFRLIEGYLLAGRRADAERVITALLKQDPKDVDALFRETLLQLDAGNRKEAEATLNRLAQVQPRSAAVHYLAARVARTRGDDLRRRGELTEALRLNPNFLPARIELVRLLVASNSASGALDLLNQTPNAQRRSLAVVTTRGLVLLALDDLNEAAKTIGGALAVARTPELLVQDAVLKLRLRDYAGARAAAAEALNSNPEDVRALRILGVTLLAQKRSDEVIKVLQKHAEQHPKSAVARQFMGEWLLETGKPQQARAAFLAAKAANPKFFPADFALVRVDTAEGNLPAARQDLSAVLQSDPANFSAHALTGNLETKAGNYPAAIEHYQKALEVQPNSAEVMNNLAYLLTETGQVDAALPLAQKAREAAPQSADIADTLGWALYRKGLYDGAVTIFQEAVAKDSAASHTNAVVRKYHLAMAYAKAGDLDRADVVFEQARKLNAKVAEAALARQVIDEAGGAPVKSARPQK